MIPLLPEFKEFLKLLNSHGVDYLLVGGYAVGLYGYVRATADIDIWLRADPQNAAKLRAALVQFGFSESAIPEGLGAKPSKVVGIGVAPQRIDLLTSVSGLLFDEAFSRRIVMELGGLPVSVVSRDDLLVNKRASGRPKDIADLDELGA